MKCNLIIAGEAGQGINVSALSLAKLFTRAGLHTFLLTENPNSIKLEPAWCSLKIADKPITAPSYKADLLIALNADAYLRHRDRVKEDGFILCESQEPLPDSRCIEVPFGALVKKISAPELLRNTVALGAFLTLYDVGIEGMKALFSETFGAKGAAIVAQNIAALEMGSHTIVETYGAKIKKVFPKEKAPPRYLLTGNEAVSLGALKAGCQFFSAYPMTPSSPIFHFLSAKEREYSLVVKQAEDEIAAIHMALGASYAGVRSMVATSGGGFCLMVEALGLSGQSETPVVIVLGQRPGPSTGQPTRTDQADLRFALHASHGEFPRVVLAPGDVREAFEETFRAFNLAEHYQVPVIVITDKYLAESYSSWEEWNVNNMHIDRGKVWVEDSEEPYMRYQITPDGISPRAFPGTSGAIHCATSYEHNEEGFYEENPENVKKMRDKRSAKISFLLKDIPQPRLYGSQDADMTLVCWGSTKGSVLEAVRILAEEGRKVNMLHLVGLSPFPAAKVEEYLRAAKKTMIIEGNETGQCRSLIREETGILSDFAYCQYDGEPLYPETIVEQVKRVW